ncbi:hypothetical protein [Nitriliruptor alkaliphilus]|uniref:hypothetical protein n=1 Tax=Nitriliruptor alkaliphilus TaxID=427918 RepID=UPI0012EDF5B8|nr:hypothetical protein [Nitriliruptor alkaliphilus]
MTRFRVDRRDNLDGTTTWYVLDTADGDKPAAQFDDEVAAKRHADELELQASPADEEAWPGANPTRPDPEGGSFRSTP